MNSPVQNDFFNLSHQDLERLLVSWGEPAFRVSQVMASAWREKISSFAQATSLPKPLRMKLDENLSLDRLPEIKCRQASPDGTRKFLFSFPDGAEVESVSIPHEKRLTFCLSTQSGCSLGCLFCATGRLGFRRNLTTGEILGQIRSLVASTKELPTNLVFMGMGEPLQNLDALRDALDLLAHPQGWRWSPSKITVSTSGWIPGLEAITRNPLPALLAFSLNAVRNDLRSRLMPVNRRYPLDQVLAALRAYSQATGQSITIEYILIKDVNDSPEDARLLARLLKNLPSKVNLIPWNPILGVSWRTPSLDKVRAFLREVRTGHALVTLRNSRGSEIGAACGQLAGQTTKRISRSAA